MGKVPKRSRLTGARRGHICILLTATLAALGCVGLVGKASHLLPEQIP
jgi:hypothetical protein